MLFSADAIERATVAMYGSKWADVGPEMKEVWRRYTRRALAGLTEDDLWKALSADRESSRSTNSGTNKTTLTPPGA